MKKKFNNEHAPKSSENCDKYSKSVSHETLVGGTATTGTGIKQTRRLFLGSANKPLTAVGTLTSLLHNSAKVVEKWLQMSPVFRLVEVLCLLVGLSVDMISESRAETKADDENLCLVYAGATAVPCIDKLTDENGNNSCGDNCTFKVIEENGKQVLHIYKEDISKPATILYGAFSPKRYKGKQVLDANGNALPLNNIMLDNDFENLGSFVFAFSGAQISSASGKLVFNNSSGYNAFMGSTVNADVIFNSMNQALESGTLNGDIVISDGIKSTGGYAFTDFTLNGNLIIPSSVESVSKLGLLGRKINGKIYCASGVEKCYDMLKSACGNDESCLNTIKERYLKKLSAYPDGCEKLEANLKCTKCKNENFKLNDGYCDRLRWTPAEAAEVLRNDNTNEVTITFKK